ncbi:MAG: hypothetical protein ABI867_21340 [Kofleriaceae bacterium]
MFKLVMLAVVAMGCAGTARSSDVYRRDTRAMLETRNAQLATCYDDALKVDPKIGGMVAVKFTVEKKTGMFTKPTIDPTRSNASEALVTCVLRVVDGLALQPPDAREGRATFVYELSAKPAT